MFCVTKCNSLIFALCYYVQIRCGLPLPERPKLPITTNTSVLLEWNKTDVENSEILNGKPKEYLRAQGMNVLNTVLREAENFW